MIEVSQRGRVTIVELLVDLDAESTPVVREALLAAEEDPASQIAIVLERCTYCDSIGLGLLGKAKQRLGDRLSVVVSHGHAVRRFFHLCDFDAYLGPYATLDDALSAAGS